MFVVFLRNEASSQAILLFVGISTWIMVAVPGTPKIHDYSVTAIIYIYINLRW